MMEPEVLISGLMNRGVPLHIAQGIVANMMAESRLNPGINELAPVVPGSRGGYGLNQWTGPRRVQLEEFAAARGADPSDPEVQLDFTLWELNNTESRAWNALQGTDSATDAARVYSERFLRPGVPHMDRRLSYARQMSGIEPSTMSPAPMGGNALGPDMPNRANILASGMPRYESPRLNAFMIERV